MFKRNALLVSFLFSILAMILLSSCEDIVIEDEVMAASPNLIIENSEITLDTITI